MNYKDTSKENVSDHIDHLVDVLDSIELGKVTILTGSNASGKSVIGRSLPHKINQRLGDPDSKKNRVATVSMRLRTNGSPQLFGTGLDHMMSDLGWESTAEHSVDLIKGLMKSFIETELPEDKKVFLVLDEFEIGMSKEVQMGTSLYINQMLEIGLPKCLGVLIVTHSDVVVKTVKHDVFLNIEGMTEDEWLNREIVPVMPDELDKWATALFKGIRDRERKN